MWPSIISDKLSDKSVLISGAGGSIGSEICRQLIALKPRRLVLYDLSELALYSIDLELRDWLGSTSDAVELVPVLGSICDRDVVRHTLRAYDVDVVLHAAAYKHVPLVEANPLAGLSNNVLGTQVLARESATAGVSQFTLISSDKAVRPANVMGASKRLAELVIQDMASRSKNTVFSIVRFGNVFGSSGSVVPLFQKQIAKGGPVTLTDPDVTRYFMTLHEAVNLVIQAGSLAKGGEIFVLDMGPPVPIRGLAEQLIKDAGFTIRNAAQPFGDIEIRVTGLRPGEKLHEELTRPEARAATRNNKVFCAIEKPLSEIEIAAALRSLRKAIAACDVQSAKAVISKWVDGYATAPATKCS